MSPRGRGPVAWPWCPALTAPPGFAGGVTEVIGVGTGLICAVAGVGLAGVGLAIGAGLAIGVGSRRCARASV